jgi:hypothetical protein
VTRNVVVTLTRHFVAGIVAPPLLSELGADYLRRTLTSLLAILLVVGLFLTRALFKKYVDLDAAWDEAGYLRAVQADTLLMIALPMVVVGIVAVLLGPLLFPDDTDYRTLSPLPITRFELFAAKYLAVVLVAGTGIVALNMLATLWFPLAIGGRWMPHTLPARIGAHAVATVAASTWAFTAVMALQGVCLVAVPSRWQRRAGLVLSGSLFVGLLLSIPYVVRMPTMDISHLSAGHAPLLWIPPVWFLGLERFLLEGAAAGGYVLAARVGVCASVIALAVTALCYVQLFRSAERLAGGVSAPVRRVQRFDLVSFVVAGLTRSPLHHTVFLLIVGGGAAILVGQMLTVLEGASLRTARPRALVDAVLAAPLLVALTATLALRSAFVLPLDPRAAWLFRITETPDARRRALDATVRILTIGALAPAVTAAAILQPYTLGSRWIAAAALTTLASLLLVEVILHDWRRVPFTCSYLPGKRVLAYTLGVLLAAFSVFVYIGANLTRWAIQHPSRLMVYAGLLLAGFAALRRERLRTWGARPLEFEDEDPMAPRRLGLVPDER